MSGVRKNSEAAPRRADVQPAVTVLVVEDSEDQRRLLRHYFERAGCRVIAVGSAEDAMDAYAEATPDLAVIDLALPAMNGWELSEQLRAAKPRCPIVISSVLDAQDYPTSDAILPKPFTGAQVLQVLHDCVPQWKADK